MRRWTLAWLVVKTLLQPCTLHVLLDSVVDCVHKFPTFCTCLLFGIILVVCLKGCFIHVVKCAYFLQLNNLIFCSAPLTTGYCFLNSSACPTFAIANFSLSSSSSYSILNKAASYNLTTMRFLIISFCNFP